MSKKEKAILLFLVFFLFVIRLYHIDTAPFEMTDSWRQGDTESIARNFAQYEHKLFYPNLNYDGPFPNVPALEIQITPYLTAILYRIFGQYYFLARLVPVTFFLVSAVFLYFFARLHMNWKGAACCLLIYGILPVNVYYSRAIMPESAALMFWIGGVYYFDLGLRHFKKRDLALSAIFMALAIMTKPPVIFAAIAMIFLCHQYFGWRWLKMSRLWIYTLLTLGLAAGYYYYSAGLSDYKFTVGITRDLIFKHALNAFYSSEAAAFFRVSLPETLGFTGLIVTGTGLLYLSARQRVFLVWLLAMLLEVIFIVSPIRLFYYLIFLTVPCALLMGNLVARICFGAGAKAGRILIGTVLVLILMLESYHVVKPMYTINTAMAQQVAAVREMTKPDDLLVIGSIEPCLLSLADRRGWRYNIRIYPYVPKDPLRELNYYIANGAKYFVPVLGKVYGDDDTRLLNYIEANYTKIESTQGYPIYILQ